MACVEKLVFASSEDGYVLEGATIRPAGSAVASQIADQTIGRAGSQTASVAPSSVPSAGSGVGANAGAAERPRAIVWVHGLTSRFCTVTTVGIGRALAECGYAFIAGNNRGHDFGTMFTAPDGKRALLGGGWEAFDECPRDIAGWIRFAESEGFREVILMGHSLGALKVAYYQARRQDPRVRGLVAASPPLRAGRTDPKLVAQAERLVAAGHGQDLLPWGIGQAGAGTVSAQTYLNRVRANVDVYGNSTSNAAVTQVRCPILAFYGTNEEWVGGPADLETIRRNATLATVETRTIEGADHSYAGYERVVAAAVADWADRLG